jgi:hypothetical protein
MLERELTNAAGVRLATIRYDIEEDKWRISTFDLRSFTSLAEAERFWKDNFDPETGKYRGPVTEP